MKKKLSIFTLVAIAFSCIVACSNNTTSQIKKNIMKETAIIETSVGTMKIKLSPEIAPGTVENFKKLANEGFYNGTCFHRIIKGFMIQGGDPLTKDENEKHRWGTGGPGYTIKAEFNKTHHAKGVISMARAAHPDSAGSQFFICHDNAGFLDGKYTAFGQLIEGDDVLEKIANVPCVGPERSSPTTRIEVKSIKVISEEAPSSDAK